METVPVFEHPAEEVTSTVYVVLAVGLATGFEMFALLNPVDGVHK